MPPPPCELTHHKHDEQKQKVAASNKERWSGSHEHCSAPTVEKVRMKPQIGANDEHTSQGGEYGKKRKCQGGGFWGQSDAQ